MPSYAVEMPPKLTHLRTVANPKSPFSPPHRIREWRERSGLTQAQLGERVGRSATEISRFERGERDLYLRDLKMIAGAMNIDAGQLLNPEDNQLGLDERQLDAVRVIVSDPRRVITMLSHVAETMGGFDPGPKPTDSIHPGPVRPRE